MLTAPVQYANTGDDTDCEDSFAEKSISYWSQAVTWDRDSGVVTGRDRGINADTLNHFKALTWNKGFCKLRRGGDSIYIKDWYIDNNLCCSRAQPRSVLAFSRAALANIREVEGVHEAFWHPFFLCIHFFIIYNSGQLGKAGPFDREGEGFDFVRPSRHANQRTTTQWFRSR